MINKTTIFIISILLILAFFQASNASDYNLNHDPQSYVLQKFKSSNIVFLGTSHRKPPILKFISDLIPKLHYSGVTHIGLEIASNQQPQIDHYMKTGNGLSNIEIHPQIDCQEYRNNLRLLRDTIPKERPTTVALDLPKSKYKGLNNRDEWMAKTIAKIFKTSPNAKIFVVVGNNHVLKKLEWQDHIVNKNRSIREYLLDFNPNMKMLSIGQVIGKSVFEDDFRKRFSCLEGSVALDLDERFAGWKSGIAQSMAIKPTEVADLLDGLIVY